MSCFGEISEPSTRSAFEDWDDVIREETFSELRLQNIIDSPVEIDTFIILEGRYLYDCVKNQHDSLQHINSIPEVNLHLYKTKTNNNYICIIKDYNLIQSSEIVATLKDYVTNSVDVVAILMKPIVEYQVGELVTKEYVLRSLLTSKQISRCVDLNFPGLEQPNIIAGVSAGALCFREIIDKTAIALVYYIDHPEEQQIDELQDVLQKLHVTSFVKNVQTNNILNSNLYI